MASPELEKLYEEATGSDSLISKPEKEVSSLEDLSMAQPDKDFTPPENESVDPGKDQKEEAFLTALQNSRNLGELARVTEEYSVNEPLLEGQADMIKNRVSEKVTDLFHLDQFYGALLKDESKNSQN